MGEAFRLGGYGMFPTAIAGLVLVAAAIRYARTPDARRLHLVRCLSVLVALIGTLGTTSGVIKAFLAAGSADPREMPGFVVTGIGEAANCIALALIMLVAGWIATSIGAYRRGAGKPGGGAELADPHAH